MNEKKRLIKNTGMIAIGNISTKLVSFFLLPLYTALLSTSEYGTFDYILSIATFCVPFVSVLMDESIFRFLIDCKKQEEKEKVISTALVIVLIGMGCFTLVGVPVMQGLHYHYTYYATIYILLNVMSGMISAILRGIGRTDQYALFNFLLGSIQVTLNVVFIAAFRMGVGGMLMASILTQFFVSTIFIFRIRLWRYFDFRIVNSQMAKDMIVYSLPLIPNKVSWSIINLSDRIVLMNWVGSEATGFYAVSYKFPNLMDTVYGFFYQSWKESSARVMGDDSQNDFYNAVYEYLKNFMYALVLGMSAFMPLIFRIMINKNYYEALFYVPILLLATYFANISGFYGGIFTAYKDTKIMGTTTLAAAILNLTINLLMIHKFGIYAAAISTLVANFLIYLYRRWKVSKYIELNEDRRETVIAIASTIVIFALFYSKNLICIGLSCFISILYAVIMNRTLIMKLWNRLKSK